MPMIVTRKIELYVAGTPVDANQDQKTRIYTFLRDLQRENWLIANKAISQLWFYQYLEENLMVFDQEQLDQLNELIRETQSDRRADAKQEKALSKERQALLNESRKQAKAKLKDAFTVTYTTLARRALAAETMSHGGLYDFKGGSYLLDGLLNRVNQDFGNDMKEVRQGKKSVRRYRNGLPIFFHNRAIRGFEAGEKEGEYYMNWLNGIRFGLVFGRDKNSRSSEIQKIIDGEYGYGDSALQIKGKKLYLLLSLKHPERDSDPIPDKSIEVDAGMLIPVECRYGEEAKTFGSADDLLRFRLQRQTRYRKLQKALTITTGGHGRKKKLAKLEDLRKLERNFINTYNHKLSTAIVKYAMRNRAGKIVVNEIKFTKDSPIEEQQFEARNWAASELSSMITYKAKLNKIEVFINKEVIRERTDPSEEVH